MLSKCKLGLSLLLFTVLCTDALAAGKKPLSEYDLLKLLRGGVYNARIIELVRERSISFVPTTNDLDRLRRAGADRSLLSAIESAPRPLPEPPAPQSTVRASEHRPEQTVRAVQFSRLDGHPNIANERLDGYANIAEDCKPGRMYSEHDVVGDPLACIRGKLVCCGAALPAIGAVGAVSVGW
jgi:hypothetical protein